MSFQKYLKPEHIKPPISRLTNQYQYLDPLSRAIMKLENLDENKDLLVQCGIYLTTNEERADKIYQRCLSEPKVDNACHIGFSGWYNLNIMALRGSTRAIICDFNPENGLFFDFTLKYLLCSQTRKEFLEKIKVYIKAYGYNTNPKLTPDQLKHSVTISPSFFCMSPLEEIESYMTSEHGWLHTEERFQHIRNLAVAGKIAAVTLDIRNVEKFKKIKNLLQDNTNVNIDTVYISNIYAYIFGDDRALFLQTINMLCASNTLLIDAAKDEKCKLTQRAHRYVPEMTEQQVLKLWPLASAVEPSVAPLKPKKSSSLYPCFTMVLCTAVAFAIMGIFYRTVSQDQATQNRMLPSI